MGGGGGEGCKFNICGLDHSGSEPFTMNKTNAAIC